MLFCNEYETTQRDNVMQDSLKLTIIRPNCAQRVKLAVVNSTTVFFMLLHLNIEKKNSKNDLGWEVQDGDTQADDDGEGDRDGDQQTRPEAWPLVAASSWTVSEHGHGGHCRHSALLRSCSGSLWWKTTCPLESTWSLTRCQPWGGADGHRGHRSADYLGLDFVSILHDRAEVTNISNLSIKLNKGVTLCNDRVLCPLPCFTCCWFLVWGECLCVMMLPQDCKQRLRLSAAARCWVDTRYRETGAAVATGLGSTLHGEKAPATFETGKVCKAFFSHWNGKTDII